MPNTVSPPVDHREGVMLMASRLCELAEKTAVDDFRAHFESCPWCQRYADQETADAPYAISEVGWWNGHGDRNRF